MKYDYIIVGQGIAGTSVCFELLQQGKTFVIFDDCSNNTASLVAGAVINPVNVNKNVVVDNAVEIWQNCKTIYQRLEQLLGVEIYSETSLFVFDKILDENNFVKHAIDDKYAELNSLFYNAVNIMEVKPVAIVNAKLLFSKWKEFLVKNEWLLHQQFDYNKLIIDERCIRYESITADKIIFCEGAKATANPYLRHFPFVKNRGEALIIEIKHKLPNAIFHYQHLRLIPITENKYWCGSNYTWNFENLTPDESWRDKTVAHLQRWLKVSFKILNHIVAERPTTEGQKILYGFLPNQQKIGFLNGLGTRGFSLAPKYASFLLK